MHGFIYFSLGVFEIIIPAPKYSYQINLARNKNFKVANDYSVAHEGGPEVYKGRYERTVSKEAGNEM